MVSGADGVEAECDRAIEDGRELDALVATDAWVRRAAGGVLGNEVVDHVTSEPLGEVPHVERDADRISRTSRVARVLKGAAPTGTLADSRRVR